MVVERSVHFPRDVVELPVSVRDLGSLRVGSLYEVRRQKSCSPFVLCSSSSEALHPAHTVNPNSVFLTVPHATGTIGSIKETRNLAARKLLSVERTQQTQPASADVAFVCFFCSCFT